jgi:hypothetical protein
MLAKLTSTRMARGPVSRSEAVRTRSGRDRSSEVRERCFDRNDEPPARERPDDADRVRRLKAHALVWRGEE